MSKDNDKKDEVTLILNKINEIEEKIKVMKELQTELNQEEVGSLDQIYDQSFSNLKELYEQSFNLV